MEQARPAKRGVRAARHEAISDHRTTGDDMLDHSQISAPQFEAGTEAADGAPAGQPSATMPAEPAPRLDAVMLMPFQIAMALPAAVLAEASSSSILRHLAWQRERARR